MDYVEIGHTFYSWSTFIVMEAGFLLYVLSSAWISWYIFSTLFTIFWPIKSTLYSVFYIKTISIKFWVWWLSFCLISQPLLWQFVGLQLSTMSYSASLPEHWQCFPREDVFLVFSLGSVWGNIVPRDVFPCTLPRAQGVYWIIRSL